MPLNTNIPLMAAQGVQAQGDSINNAFNTYYGAQQNKRQNALLDMQQRQQEADNQRKNALFDMQQKQASQQTDQFKFEMDAAQGAQMYRMFQSLGQLSPEMRAAQIEFMKPALMQRGFDDDDWDLLATDEGIKQGMAVMSRYAPIAKAEIGRYKTEKLPDGSTVIFDSATSATRNLSSPQPIDLSILPESMRSDVSKLPRESQEKIVNEFASPKTQTALQEKAEQDKKATQLKERTLAMVEELLGNESGVKSVLGGIDSFTPTLLNSSKDAEAGLEDLRNLLTVENLGIMSGVLSESDMKIIQSIGASGLSGSQERVLNRLKEMRAALRGEGQAAPENTGRFKVRVRN